MGKKSLPPQQVWRSHFLAALITAVLLARPSWSSWCFAGQVAPIAGPNAERLSVEACYPGLHDVAAFLARHPDRRVAAWLLHAEERVTTFDPRLAVGALLVETLFPRRVEDVRMTSPALLDLVVLPPGDVVDWPHRVALETPLAKILEAHP